MKFPSSLHSRLVLSHLLVSLISITLISIFAGSAIFSAARSEIEHNLEDLAFAASNGLENRFQEMQEGRGDATQVQMEIVRLLANHPELHFTIYLPDGAPFVDSQDQQPPHADQTTTPEVWDALNNQLGEGEAIRWNDRGSQTLYIAVRIERENNVFGVLRLGTALSPALATARRSLGLLLLVASLMVIASSLFAWLLANNLARPIEDLTQAAGQLAMGDMGVRVQPSGTQEMARLTEVFNTMAGRLQMNVSELRAFVANASHELRTPLTVVKLRAEALQNGAMEDHEVAMQFLGDIETEVDRLVLMVNDLLDLSRLEAGMVASPRSLFNLGNLATEVYETFSIRAAKAGLNLELDIEPDLPALKGSEDQLRRVLYNFVDNAIKYTPSGGMVQVFLRSGRQGKWVRLLVRDTGPGISSEHLPHIFERFYRVEATRPRYGPAKGSGLGLAISKSIIENHGGKIGVSSQPGKGTTFWAELPTGT